MFELLIEFLFVIQNIFFQYYGVEGIGTSTLFVEPITMN